ncbi:MAG: GNAT family N-acetyltransferase [Bacteroidales bacterium]
MGKFEVRYLSDNEIGSWDEFVDTCEYGSIFHKSTWIESLKQSDSFTNIDIIGCFNKDGEILAGAILPWKPVLKTFKVVVLPYATSFSGIVIEERDSEFLSKKESYRFELLEALLGFMEKRYDSISVIFPPSFNDIRVFKWRNYDLEILYTYQGDLAEVRDNSFLPDIRRRIKKAEKLDYSIKNNMDDDHLRVVFDLISKSYKRQNHIFRFTKDAFFRFCKSDDLEDNILVYSIWKAHIPVSAIVILKDQDKAYYWIAGGDHTLFDTGLNQLLLWKVIESLKSKGVRWLDLVGANTPSISRYKSGYNFDLQPYYLVSKDTNPVFHILFTLKKTIQGILSKSKTISG